MKHNEGGYIVVETITSFLLFVLLNISILSLINIVTVQARIHYALTQAAEAVSMYTYTLNVMGVTDHLVTNAKKASQAEESLNEVKTHINDVISAVNSLDVKKSVEGTKVLYNDAKDTISSVREDPEAAFQLFLNYNLQEGLDALFGEAIRPLIGRYLANGSMTGDQFLRTFHVEGGLSGLQFNDFDALDLHTTKSDDSRFLTGGENVKIVLEYNIDYTFGALPLPFTKLHITQEVMTRAWLNGLGEGYTG